MNYDLIRMTIITLFIILISEYGLRTRKQIILHLNARFSWKSSGLRLLLWLLLMAWGRQYPSPGWWVFAGMGFLLTEAACLLLRIRFRRDVAHNMRYGRAGTHLLPLLLCCLPSLCFYLSGLFWDLTSFTLTMPVSNRVLFMLTALVGLLGWATMLAISTVSMVRPGEFPQEITLSIGGGEIIGILERMLTFMLILAGALPAVGFAIAAKAAARFPQFKDPVFAEYFLIGTLCSIGTAVLCGLLLTLM